MQNIKTKFGKLRINDMAPDFEAVTDKGEQIRLSDFRGKFVVLYFYPKAFTPGCTKEAKGFRDIYDSLKSNNTEVLGISTDSPETLANFRNKQKLSFVLVSDQDKSVSSQFSGVGLLGKSNRMTYLIDPEGRIRKIWKLKGLFAQLNLYKHAHEVKEVIEELQVVY